MYGEKILARLEAERLAMAAARAAFVQEEEETELQQVLKQVKAEERAAQMNERDLAAKKAQAEAKLAKLTKQPSPKKVKATPKRKPALDKPVRRKRTYTVNGECRTRREWAKILGVNPKTINRRLKAGMTIEQALGKERHEKARCKQYECRGKLLTLRQWAEEVEVSLRLIRARISNNWTIEQALGFEKRQEPRRAALYTYNNKSQTLSQWAAELNINYMTLYHRLRRGVSLEAIAQEASSDEVIYSQREAAKQLDLTPKKFRRYPKPTHTSDCLYLRYYTQADIDNMKCWQPKFREATRITYDGISLTFKEWAKETGIKRNTISNRLIRGWTIPQALGFEQREKRKSNAARYTCNGRSLTIREWAKETGIKHCTIERRLYKGWTVPQAVGFEQRGKHPPRCTRYTCNGKSLTYKEWAKETGISYELIYSRVHHGWTFEQALGFEKRPKPTACGRRFSYDNKTLTIREWEKETGVSHDSIERRLRKGWTFEQAIGIAKPPVTYRKAKVYTYLGKTQPLQAWADELGFERWQLERKTLQGFTLEEAILGRRTIRNELLTQAEVTRMFNIKVPSWAYYRRKGTIPPPTRTFGIENKCYYNKQDIENMRPVLEKLSENMPNRTVTENTNCCILTRQVVRSEAVNESDACNSDVV